MGNCLPFSKYIEPATKHKNSENSQVESSVKDISKVNSDYDSMEFNPKQLQSISPLQCQSSFGFGSKEEIFFDSYDQAWLESDIEDFQSVNSDSTTMDMSSTPQLHDNNSIASSQSDILIAGENSSSEMKKQLIDLFRDSFSNDVTENKDIQQQTTTETNATAFYVPPKSDEKTPNGRSSNRTKPKSPQVSCCLPNLVRSLSSSSSEKKKK
ncbi:hypothetical protein M5689_019779 [Euphorbia peplus]|nr:hypothetical protein M5689_019779 [Euphorbia peplus]